MKSHKKNIARLGVLFVALVFANLLSYLFFERIDFTDDNRYTLSAATKNILAKAEKPLRIEVFLKGEYPAEFRKLQFETQQLLEEFAATNPNVKFTFTNPLKNKKNPRNVASQFYEMGMIPARINVVEQGRTSQTIIFPWAVAHYGNKVEQVQLLINSPSSTSQERTAASVQQLQYAFANAFSKLLKPKSKKIAVMRGNGELPDAYIADYVRSLQEYYFTAAFTLDSVTKNAQKTLKNLKKYDLVLELGPTQAFSEKEKYVLDQYLMNGGKMLWLVDAVATDTDSLFASGSSMAMPRNLNLGDYFFKYGVRINPVLVKDLYSAPIILATGTGQNTQLDPYPWYYYPLAISPNNHPINNNIGPVKFEYASSLDTLKNSIRKTILLQSSKTTKLIGVPKRIRLESLSEKPDFPSYNEGPKPLAVLLEGRFTSVYKNRIKPFKIANFREKGKASKMIVITDANVAKNQLKQGRPLTLGFEKFTGETYANKDFLINAANYLLDDNGLINLRSKSIQIAFLDLQKVEENRLLWQLTTVLVPLVVLAVFGGFFIYFRKRKYRF